MNKLNHVAIIMDGNGRWGLKKKGSRNYGHIKGIEVVENIIRLSIIEKIPYLTLYTFSTDVLASEGMSLLVIYIISFFLFITTLKSDGEFFL